MAEASSRPAWATSKMILQKKKKKIVVIFTHWQIFTKIYELPWNFFITFQHILTLKKIISSHFQRSGRNTSSSTPQLRKSHETFGNRADKKEKMRHNHFIKTAQPYRPKVRFYFVFLKKKRFILLIKDGNIIFSKSFILIFLLISITMWKLWFSENWSFVCLFVCFIRQDFLVKPWVS